MEGRFSERSDVYSLGVLMLEIVKGEKNSHYYNHEWSLSLIGCAWKLWSENNGLGFADESIASGEMEEDIVRCIHIGLLCVQDSPKDRPIVQTVVSMLSREIAHSSSQAANLGGEVAWLGNRFNRTGKPSRILHESGHSHCA
ncbi:cysteine-rich receptor-like protein kinase 10 [Salvia miltiorrhiza]|uniref:cysteine-rich receptor-like protein kinase 10 n=1 Tax=Salvia miltiorrhiza TaxID=226208 RepID=UPI0025ACF8DD|nr:cysteine-rich receptor-like protein kinase 10 [Salvia miltiorrhiza]